MRILIFLRNLLILSGIIGAFFAINHFSDEIAPLRQSSILSDFVHQGQIVAIAGHNASDLSQSQRSELVLEDSADKLLLVNFWASWCEACEKEKPLLKELSEQFSGGSLYMLGIASNDNFEDLKRNGLIESANFPVILDKDGQISQNYHVESLPQTILFTPDGTEIYRVKGPLDQQSKLELIQRVNDYVLPRSKNIADRTVAENDSGQKEQDDSNMMNAEVLPQFSLLSPDSKEVKSSKELNDHVWIANFVFTRCQSTCPLLSKKMKSIHDQFSNPTLKMVSFSVDPEHDRPEVLKEYANTYSADESRWLFLTGEWYAIKNLMQNGFKIGVPDQPMFHSEKFVLVDKDMKIRGYYDANSKRSYEQLKKDISTLLNYYDELAKMTPVTQKATPPS